MRTWSFHAAVVTVRVGPYFIQRTCNYRTVAQTTTEVFNSIHITCSDKTVNDSNRYHTIDIHVITAAQMVRLRDSMVPWLKFPDAWDKALPRHCLRIGKSELKHWAVARGGFCRRGLLSVPQSLWFVVRQVWTVSFVKISTVAWNRSDFSSAKQNGQL